MTGAGRIEPAAPTVALVSVERAPVRMMTSLVGAHPAVRDDKAEVVGLEFRWEDGSQLEFALDSPGQCVLSAIENKYGSGAVRDLLVLYLLTWTARAPAGESLWWWPDEHLETIGLARSAENRRRLLAWLDRMSRSRLRAVYRKGKPLVGPLVTVSLTDTRAYRLHLHPALYQGVTKHNGKRGKWWWPVPMAVLRRPADRSAGRIHALAPVLGQLWRIDLGRANRGDREPEARIGVERLAEVLNVRGRTRKGRDNRAAGTLRRTLQAAKECDLIGSWRVERGDLDRLTGTLTARPGATSLTAALDKLDRPAWIPATGRELSKWTDSLGLASADLGDALNRPAATVRSWRRYGDRPLPAQVRGALRELLWPERGCWSQGGCLPTSVDERGGVCPKPIRQVAVMQQEMWCP